MTCTFFGHKDTPDHMKEEIKKVITHLVEHNGVDKFYVGNNGNFDFLVQKILNELCSNNKSIHYCIVTSRVNEKAISGFQDATIFPEALDNALPKFSISKRNDWMIANSSYAICYVNHKFSNSFAWVEKAKKKGLQVINLGKMH